MSCFWLVLFFRCLLHNGTYCVRLDESCVAAMSRERSTRPTKHVTFALSQQKSAYPAHTQELDAEGGDKPRARSDRTTVSEDEDEDNKPLVQPASRSEQLKRESPAIRRIPTPLKRRKRTSSLARPSATLEQDVSRTSRERPENVSSLRKKKTRR